MSLNAARPIALLLRQLHIGIVDVLVNPVFGEFIFGHYRTIPRMPILELTSRERSDLRSAAHPCAPSS